MSNVEERDVAKLGFETYSPKEWQIPTSEFDRVSYVAEQGEDAISMGLTPIVTIGKSPIQKDWSKSTLQSASAVFTIDRLQRLYQDGQFFNLGVLNGKGVTILDIDLKDRGMEVFLKFLDEFNGGQLFDTPTVVTGRGGLHMYFKHCSAAPVNANKCIRDEQGLIGWDFPGQCIYPGSIHPDTHQCYMWMDDFSPDDVQPMAFPKSLLNYIASHSKTAKPAAKQPVKARPTKAVQKKVEPCPFTRDRLMDLLDELDLSYSDDYTQWQKIIWAIAACQPDEETDYYEIALWFSEKCPQRFDKNALDTLWSNWSPDRDDSVKWPHLLNALKDSVEPKRYSTLLKQWKISRPVSSVNLERSTDVDLARYLHKKMCDNVKCVSRQPYAWLMWTPSTKLWLKVPTDTLVNDAMDLLVSKFEKKINKTNIHLMDARKNNKDGHNDALIEKLTVFCKFYIKEHARLHRSRAVSDVVTRLGQMVSDPAFDKRINTRVNIFPIQNGLCVDLDTGLVRERTRDDLVSSESPVIYDPKARHPQLESFLNDISLDANGDHCAELHEYLRNLLAYCLSADNRAKLFWVLIGDGNNGKSLFSDMIEALIGDDFFVPLLKQAVMQGRKMSVSDHSDALVQLANKRVAVVAETKSGDILDEGRLKQIVGETKMSARAANQGQIGFNQTAKVIIHTNDFPEASKDKNFWSKMMVVPFNVKYVPANQVTDPRHRAVNPDIKYDLPNDANALSALLNWVIVACDGGISQIAKRLRSVPQIVQEEAEMRRNEHADPFEEFMAETYEKVDGEHVLISSITTEWKKWKRNLKYAIPNLSVATALVDGGYQLKKIHGMRLVRGIQGF